MDYLHCKFSYNLTSFTAGPSEALWAGTHIGSNTGSSVPTPVFAKCCKMQNHNIWVTELHSATTQVATGCWQADTKHGPCGTECRDCLLLRIEVTKRWFMAPLPHWPDGLTRYRRRLEYIIRRQQLTYVLLRMHWEAVKGSIFPRNRLFLGQCWSSLLPKERPGHNRHN